MQGYQQGYISRKLAVREVTSELVYLTDSCAQLNVNPVTDLSREQGMRPRVQILLISCSFWEFLAIWYVCTPSGGIVSPPRGNPGSATAVLKKCEVHELTAIIHRGGSDCCCSSVARNASDIIRPTICSNAAGLTHKIGTHPAVPVTRLTRFTHLCLRISEGL